MRTGWLRTLLLILPLIVTGCSKEPEEARKPEASYKPVPAEQSLVRKPELRESLPESAIGYIRIPNPWGFVSSPKGDLFAPIMGDKVHVEAVRDLRKAMYEKVVEGKADNAANDLLSVLVYYLRSPLEVAVLAPEPNDPPAPKLLIAASLDMKAAALDQLLQQMAASNPQLNYVESIGSGGYARLSSGPFAVHVKYDTTSGSLRIMGGLGVTRGDFDRTLEGLTPREHIMHAAEKRIDTSGQGFFEWFDIDRTLAMLEKMMPPAQLAPIKDSPLQYMDNVAAGWGVSEGKGRARVLVDTRIDGLGEFFSMPTLDERLSAAGTPRTVAWLTLPGPSQLARIEQLLSQSPGFKADKYEEGKGEFTKRFGVSVEQIAQALGPDLVLFTDEVGEFGAIRIRDAQAWQQMLKSFVAATGNLYEEKTAHGVTYHHLVLPRMLDEEKLRAKEDPGVVLMMQLLSGKSHLYWTEEDGYLVMAGVPQALWDRKSYGRPASLKAWMTGQQHQDVGAAVAMASTTIEDSPRHLYYAYLGLLTHLADLADYPIDLAKLPSAMELGLPEQGTYGLQVDVDGKTISAQFTFEHNPMEILLDQKNAMGGVAVVGILAAIAIPAYQDYTMRARVMEGVTLASPVKNRIGEYYYERGRFPDAEALAGFALPDSVTVSITVTPETGEIVISYTAPKLSDSTVVLVPEISGNQIHWTCVSDLPDKYLPKSCRM